MGVAVSLEESVQPSIVESMCVSNTREPAPHLDSDLIALAPMCTAARVCGRVEGAQFVRSRYVVAGERKVPEKTRASAYVCPFARNVCAT